MIRILKIALIALCFLMGLPLFSQQLSPIDTTIRFEQTGGLVAYYFWEEDSNGVIVHNRIHKPFFQNFAIQIYDEKSISSAEISEKELILSINEFAHDFHRKEKKKRVHIEKDSLNSNYKLPLIKTISEEPTAMLYIHKGANWQSKKRGNVLYFVIDQEGNYRFSHASDSIILTTMNIRRITNNQYMVLSYLTTNDSSQGSISKQEVFNYTGRNITRFFKDHDQSTAQRVIVFANGYRGPEKNRDVTDNLITSHDRYHYWYKLDDAFITALNPEHVYYMDGSMGVNTSVHGSKLGFGWSYVLAKIFPKAEKSSRILNTGENPAGFEKRMDQGRIAGRSFLQAICTTPACEGRIDTVDIVCHSMGYAYSLGFIEELKGKVVFGKIYILAPESACERGYNWTEFEEVWQYGSNLDQKDKDMTYEQDGVAPQCPVKGIELVDPEHGGRVFIPKDWPYKDFIKSHDTKYFHWIFECINPGEPGFVKKN